MNSSERSPQPDGTQGRCPRCGAVPTPIVYGYPSSDLFEAAERGEVVLGGCVVFDDQPTSRCTECGAVAGGRAEE